MIIQVQFFLNLAVSPFLLLCSIIVRNVLKVSEPNHSVKERASQESFRGKYEVWRGREVETGEGVGKFQRYGNGV